MSMLSILWEHADKWADFATILTAVLAALAVGFGFGFYIGERRSERESFAKGLLRDLGQLAIDYPQFVEPNLVSVDYVKKTFDGSREKFTSYESFLGLTLWTWEEVLDVYYSDRLWRECAMDALRYHRDYLRSGLYGDFNKYLRKHIAQVLQTITEEQVSSSKSQRIEAAE